MSAIMAKAINSTIGTSDFKSFDEILLSEKCFVPTNDVLATFPGGQIWTVPGANETAYVSFKSPAGGSINVNYTITNASEATPYMLLVYVDGVLQQTISHIASETSSKAVTIVVKRNSEVIIKRKNGSGWLVNITGKLIDCKPFEITKLA